jgi:PPOX class probable F420-dependent enzyme
MSPAPDLNMSLDEVRELLAEPHTGVLSTIGPGGFPHSVGIFYVMEAEPLELTMWVYGKSQKAVNVRSDPRASLLVEHGEPYADLRGVLVRGRAHIETDPIAVATVGKKIYERYFFPRTGVTLEDGAAANVERQSAKRVNIVLTATTVSSWDHSRGKDAIPRTGGTG